MIPWEEVMLAEYANQQKFKYDEKCWQSFIFSCIIPFLLFLLVVDCQWNKWKLGDCSKTCGGGIRTNTRTKKVLSAHGGDDCDGLASVNENCNVQACPGIEHQVYHS